MKYILFIAVITSLLTFCLLRFNDNINGRHNRLLEYLFKRDEGGKPNPMILFVFEILLTMVNPKHKVLIENFHSEPSYGRRKVACLGERACGLKRVMQTSDDNISA